MGRFFATRRRYAPRLTLNTTKNLIQSSCCERFIAGAQSLRGRGLETQLAPKATVVENGAGLSVDRPLPSYCNFSAVFWFTAISDLAGMCTNNPICHTRHCGRNTAQRWPRKLGLSRKEGALGGCGLNHNVRVHLCVVKDVRCKKVQLHFKQQKRNAVQLLRWQGITGTDKAAGTTRMSNAGGPSSRTHTQTRTHNPTVLSSPRIERNFSFSSPGKR